MIKPGARIAGYASLFGAPDLIGDVVHAGAFAGALRHDAAIPMWLEHNPRLHAGVWRPVFEDGRGLFVRGRIFESSPAAGTAVRMLTAGVDGLSIGFRAERFRRRCGGGRDLLEVTLFEISIVRKPMAPRARLWVEDIIDKPKEKRL